MQNCILLLLLQHNFQIFSLQPSPSLFTSMQFNSQAAVRKGFPSFGLWILFQIVILPVQGQEEAREFIGGWGGVSTRPVAVTYFVNGWWWGCPKRREEKAKTTAQEASGWLTLRINHTVICMQLSQLGSWFMSSTLALIAHVSCKNFVISFEFHINILWIWTMNSKAARPSRDGTMALKTDVASRQHLFRSYYWQRWGIYNMHGLWMTCMRQQVYWKK